MAVQSRRQHRRRMAGRHRPKGNEGVANNVGQTKGAIGYVEYAYALQNNMT